ncbi:MAG: riboflavin kinase [Actinomycetota bacterium]
MEIRLTGIVVPGDGRGHELGFPTANLGCADVELPPDGIYAGTVGIEGVDVQCRAVVSVGGNPTFAGERARRAEVHVLDADMDLYGRRLDVCLRFLLRDTYRFDDVQDLIAQSRADVARCRALLGASI